MFHFLPSLLGGVFPPLPAQEGSNLANKLSTDLKQQEKHECVRHSNV